MSTLTFVMEFIIISNNVKAINNLYDLAILPLENEEEKS